MISVSKNYPEMNSLNQYLELYRQNSAELDGHSCAVMNDARKSAFESLALARLPRKGEEGYERTDLEALYARDYGVNLFRMNFRADVAASFHCDVPNMSTLLGVVVNDVFRPSRALLERLPEGVTFTGLCEAAKTKPELLRNYYGSMADTTQPAVALNTMLAQDGVLIHIAAGVRLEKPLQLVNIFNSPTSLLALRRVLVVLEEGAEASVLVCDHTQNGDMDYMADEVVEVSLGRGASLNYYCIEESTARTVRHSQIFVRQSEGSRLSLGSLTLTCGNTRNEFSIDLTGQCCETYLSGMVIGSDNQVIDNSVNLRHLSGKCRSNQIFKYVLTDNATGAFGGRIFVAKGAALTDAYQTNRNLLAGEKARMHSKPQLEIYNDDVKCSHGASTGQLSEEALFYMRSRGIPEEEARMMLMQAFMADVIDRVRPQELRERLHLLVQHRFAGHRSASCADCSSMCKEELKPTVD